MIKDIAFFCYAVTDIPKARAFYEGILGLKTNDEYDGSGGASWIEYAVGSTTLSIGSSPEWPPSEQGASAAFEVDDFDAMISLLKKKGVIFTLEPQDFPTCRMAVITDPDKNKIIIHQKKSKK
jgi:predicted enzyme related to lactoylglutathione lyase